jgi:outer membrane protein assembly factor BamB
VSNGEQIAEIARDGSYRLPWDDGRHRLVFVIPPDGYRSVGPWWHARRGDSSMPASTDFALRRHRPASAGNAFSFLHVTDFHVNVHPPDAGSAHGKSRSGRRIDFPSSEILRATLEAQIAAAPSDIEFVVATGDLTDDGDPESLAAVARVLDSLPLPVFTIFGGHDGNMELREARGADRYNVVNWTEHLSPPYYSWHWGGRHFVSFVSETSKYIDAETQRMHETFIAEDLRLVGRRMPTTVCSHKHPFPWNVGAFRDGRVDSWFHGHFHSTRVMHDGAIRVFSTSTPLFGGLDGSVTPARVVRVSGDATPTAPILVPPMTVRGSRTSAARVALRWRSDFDRPSRLADPRVAGDAIYCAAVDDAAGVDGGVACLAPDTGALRWFARLGGSVEAPVAIAGDRIIAVTQVGHVACLDASRGEILWQYDLPETYDRWIYAPPLIVGDDVVIGTTSALTCLRIDNGAKRWEFRDPRKSSDAFGQFQTSLYRDGKLFLGGYKTGSYLFDARTGQVLRENEDDRDTRFTSRVFPHDRLYIIGDGIGGLSCYEIVTGQRLWYSPVSQSMITSAFVPFCGGLLGGTEDGLVYCSIDDGRVLASRSFGEDLGQFVAYRGIATGVHSCTGTPLVDGELAFATSGDGYLNVVRGAELSVVDRLPLEAPILSSLIRSAQRDNLLGVSVDGRLNCFRADR